MAGTLRQRAVVCERCGDTVSNKYRRWFWCSCGRTAIDSNGNAFTEEDA